MKIPALEPISAFYADAAQPIMMSVAHDVATGGDMIYVLLSNGQLASYFTCDHKWELLRGNLFEDLIKEK